MNKALKFGPYLIALAAVLWGLDGIIRRSLYSLPPIVIVFYEHLFGAIIIAPFLIPKLKTINFSKKEWGAIFWVSLLSGVFGALWFTTALLKTQFIPFSVVFLIQKLQPIFAVAVAALLLKEKITKKYFLWAGLALLAAFFMTFENGIVNLQTGAGTAVAALFALGAAFAWGSSTAFSRFALFKGSDTLVTGLRFWITTVLALLFVVAMGAGSELGAPTSGQFLKFLMIALSTGMVALWIYYKGLKNTQVKVATILELAFPLVAVLVDIFVYKTFLAPTQYLAAFVLLFAMYRVAQLNAKEGVETKEAVV